MNAIARTATLLVDPSAGWTRVEKEPGDAIFLLSGYVAVLALIPALAGFILPRRRRDEWRKANASATALWAKVVRISRVSPYFCAGTIEDARRLRVEKIFA